MTILRLRFFVGVSLFFFTFQLACSLRQNEILQEKKTPHVRSPTAGDRETLKYYRQLWEQNEPSHYKYKFSCECQCKFSTYYPKDTKNGDANQTLSGKWIQIEVKDGKIIAAYLEDGLQDDIFIQNISGENPLTHLFRLVENLIETGAKELIIKYNGELGFIENSRIDLTDAVDDERVTIIKDYEVLK